MTLNELDVQIDVEITPEQMRTYEEIIISTPQGRIAYTLNPQIQLNKVYRFKGKGHRSFGYNVKDEIGDLYIKFILKNNTVKETLKHEEPQRTMPKNTTNDTAKEITPVKKRSIEDNNTWEALAYDIDNMAYSSQTIFKLLNTREINLAPLSISSMLYSPLNSIKPMYLYDNIIFGTSNNKPALVIGERSIYCQDEVLKTILETDCPLPVAKTVIGNEVANFIRQMLSENYRRTLTKKEFITLCDYTSNFKLEVLNAEVSQWVCNELENQVGTDNFPTAYRNGNFSEWRNSYPTGTYKNNTDVNIKWIYSIGCFLENVLKHK